MVEMKKTSLILSLTALILLSGCNEEKFIPKTKEYYLQNPDIAKTRSAECKKLGAMKEDIRIDCFNANMAVNEIISRSNNPIIGDEKVIGW
jgi:PBP1b-binding outer membrane lipoprotein LpoB